ncbi:MAG: hypothetical protein ABEJ72_00595, partial [Candidatus Aenigmatarchaeota archaeon]
MSLLTSQNFVFREGVKLIIAALIGIIAASLSLRGEGLIFGLDMIRGPGAEFLGQKFYGLVAPRYGATLLIDAYYTASSNILGVSGGQKLFIILALASITVSGLLYLRGERLYAAAVLLVNPYVYIRILAGHW